MGSVSATNLYGRAALDFVTLAGCEQLVHDPTHIFGNCLDLLLTDDPAVVDVDVVLPIGSSDHSSLSFKVQTRFSLPDVTLSRIVYLKSRANWAGINADLNDVCWSGIYNADCPVSSLNDALISISNRRIPHKTIRSRRNDKAWFNDNCRAAQRDKQEAFCQWSQLHSHESWQAYVRLRAQAQRTFAAAQRAYNDHLSEVLTGASQPHSW